MKLKSIRCGICDTWNHASRNHCYFCGSTRAIKVGSKVYHLDYTALMQGKNLEIVRGTYSHLTLSLFSDRAERADGAKQKLDNMMESC